MALSKQFLTAPSGFPDLGPGEAIALDRMLSVIRRNFELAGYAPIETPLVERPEVLSAKAEGEIRNQVYGLRLLNPAPDADDTKGLALRFDQTVPLARFVAANYGNLPFPFRRYVIGPVFRGERPKDGRYRQFIQADIDVIGDETLDLLNDAEIVSVISGIFTELAIGTFTVRIGNRKILEGLLQSVGVPESSFNAALGIIDRIEKLGRATVLGQLVQMGIEAAAAEQLVESLVDGAATDDLLVSLKKQSLNARYASGVKELEEVIKGVRRLGVPEEQFRADISIARGLDYYTGTVYETRFDAYPDLGSIASGGRYDDLASVFIDRQLPGVGISIGVTRLLLRLIKAGLVDAKKTTPASVLVTTADGINEGGEPYLAQAAQLRSAGIATELYLADRPLKKQMAYAAKRGFQVAIISRAENFANGTVVVRNMATSEQEEVPEGSLVETVQEYLTAN